MIKDGRGCERSFRFRLPRALNEGWRFSRGSGVDIIYYVVGDRWSTIRKYWPPRGHSGKYARTHTHTHYYILTYTHPDRPDVFTAILYDIPRWRGEGWRGYEKNSTAMTRPTGQVQGRPVSLAAHSLSLCLSHTSSLARSLSLTRSCARKFNSITLLLYDAHRAPRRMRRLMFAYTIL